MVKKDLIIAVLITFCLTATLFLILPTRSQIGVYDPWADIDEDGRISMNDIGYAARLFSTEGDPTKNVTIAGHASKLAYSGTASVAPHPVVWQTGWISVDGYSKVTVSIQTDASLNQYYLWSKNSVGGAYFYADWAGDFKGTIVKTYDVPNQEIMVGFVNQEEVSRNVWVDIYLVA